MHSSMTGRSGHSTTREAQIVSGGVNQIESRNIPLLDIKFCSHQNPCANGGVCSTDYKCQCPSEFLGPRCETPVSKVHCTLERVCKHGSFIILYLTFINSFSGGTCVSVNRTNVQCKCIRGFLGSLCEIGIHGNCSAMRCSVDETCQIRASFAVCAKKEKSAETVTGTGPDALHFAMLAVIGVFGEH